MDPYGAPWSPDGSMIVFQERDNSTQHLGDIVVMDADGRNRTQLTNIDQTLRLRVVVHVPELCAGW